MSPPAPPLLITTIFASLPRYFSMYGMMRRADRSVPPPGGNGTISVIGRSGYAACAAVAAKSRAPRAPRANALQSHLSSLHLHLVFRILTAKSTSARFAFDR